MRERSQLNVREGSTREDLEGRLASGGWQLESYWVEEIPCEL
jgi:hypothetical protein